MDYLKSIFGQDGFNDFMEFYFEKKHKVLKNALDKKFLSPERDWFKLILLVSKSMPSNLRANKSGSVLQPPENISANDLAEWAHSVYLNGATIVLNYVERLDLELFDASRKIGRDLGASVTFTFFFTPSQSQGFVPHFDTLDVFIFQLFGSKNWAIAQNQVALPTTKQGYLVDKERSIRSRCDGFELEQGDMLYIPRGLVHWAETQQESSIHITCDINSVTLGQVLKCGYRARAMNILDYPLMSNKNVFMELKHIMEAEYDSIDSKMSIESSIKENELFK